MKKRWMGIRVVTGLCAALGWWGLLYPELALTPDAVRVLQENPDGTLQEVPADWDFEGSLYMDLLHSDPYNITFRSRLLTDISLFLEAIHSGNE